MNDLEKQLLTKRFQTTMIGALFEFEKAFGYLWGQDKNDDQLTDTDLKFLDKWDFVRNQILNNGNNQLRKAISDLENLQSKTFKYKYRFYNHKNNKKDEL